MMSVWWKLIVILFEFAVIIYAGFNLYNGDFPRAAAFYALAALLAAQDARANTRHLAA